MEKGGRRVYNRGMEESYVNGKELLHSARANGMNEIPDSGAPIIWCPKVAWEQHLSFGVVTVVIQKVYIWVPW